MNTPDPSGNQLVGKLAEITLCLTSILDRLERRIDNDRRLPSPPADNDRPQLTDGQPEGEQPQAPQEKFP